MLLPGKNEFNSPLSGKGISDTEYQQLERKQMKDYHNLYLICDALLLVDIFEKFIDVSLFEYASYKLGCNALYDLSRAMSYFRR